MVYSTRLRLPVSQVSASFLFEYTKDFCGIDVKFNIWLGFLNLICLPSDMDLHQAFFSALCLHFLCPLPPSYGCVCLGNLIRNSHFPTASVVSTLCFPLISFAMNPQNPQWLMSPVLGLLLLSVLFSFSPLNSLQSNLVSLSNTPFLSLNNFLDLPCFFT